MQAVRVEQDDGSGALVHGHSAGGILGDLILGEELAAGTYAPRVREDFRSGVTSGVNGTPTFFINGSRYDESWEVEALVAALERTAAEAAARPGR